MRRLLSFPKVQRTVAAATQTPPGLTCSSALADPCLSVRWHADDQPSHVSRGRQLSTRIVPLSTEDIRTVPRLRRVGLDNVNARAFVDGLGIVSTRNGHASSSTSDAKPTGELAVAIAKLCPTISDFIFELGVPLAVEQVAELFVPAIVFAEDAICGRDSKGSVLLLDDIESATAENPGYMFHQSSLGSKGGRAVEALVQDWYHSENTHTIPVAMAARVHMVDNDAFDRYFGVLLDCLMGEAKEVGLFVGMDNDGRPYVMPGTSEFFLRRLYPCIRKDTHKALWHVCLSAGWTGFGRSRLSDVVVLEMYFDHIRVVMGDDAPFELSEATDLVNGAGESSILLRRKQDAHVLPSVNELSRYTPALPSTAVPPQPAIVTTGLSAPSVVPLELGSESPLFKLYSEVVLPQAHRVQTRGLATLLAYLQSERDLLTRFDEKSPYQLIALATRLSTPSFVLEVLAGCPAKRAKDPTLGPLPSWCFPLYAGYFVAGDDMKGIAEMHVRTAVKTVLHFDKSDNDMDSLRNACLELKHALFQHHQHLAGMHAHVLLCSFRFMQKHEQLHRALKKSIVAADDAQVKASRIKEITGNVLNSLTELEYCINNNLMEIPTVPLAPGRVAPVSDPADVKAAKASALYQYWYLDWLASHC